MWLLLRKVIYINAEKPISRFCPNHPLGGGKKKRFFMESLISLRPEAKRGGSLLVLNKITGLLCMYIHVLVFVLIKIS